MSRRSWFHRVIAALVTAVMIAAGMVALDSAPSAAVGGDLDAGFGTGGITLQPASASPFVARVARFDQRFGRILVAGKVPGAGGQGDSTLNRFTRDGQVDPTFPGGGQGITWDAGGNDEVWGVAWDEDADTNPSTFTEAIYTASTRFHPSSLELTTSVIQRRDTNSDNLVDPTIVQTIELGAGVREPQLRIYDETLIVAAIYSTSGGPGDIGQDYDAVFVRRYDLSGDLAVLDLTFGGGDGEVIFNFGTTRAVFQALDVDFSGRISLGAHSGFSGLLARLNPDGSVDTTFGGGLGYVTLAGDKWITSIDTEGPLTVSGAGFDGLGGHITVFEEDGTLDDSFDLDGQRRFPGNTIWSATRDFQGRVQFAYEFGGVAGRLLPDGSDDPSFGTNGRTASTCPFAPDGRIVAVLNDVTQPVIAGNCGGQFFAARFEPDQWRRFDYAISPSGSAARQQIPLDRTTLQALSAVPEELQSSPLRGTPLRGTPLRGTPLRGTPLRGTPLRGTDLQDTPLRGTPLRGTALELPLSSIPLIQDEEQTRSWTEVLAPTPYKDVPLTNVTLGQVLALPTPPDVLAGLTLADIPLRGTPLRGTSITSLLLGQLFLSELPTPDGGWCAFLEAPGPTCVQAGGTVNPDTWTLLDLEIAGTDLSNYFDTEIRLAGLPLDQTALGLTKIVDLDLLSTPFGALTTSQARSAFACTDCTGTLGQLQQTNIDQINPTMNVAQLVALTATLLPDLSFGDLIPGFVRPEDLPIEDLPLQPLLDRAPLRFDDDENFRGEAEWELNCTSAADVEPNLRIVLPDGARFVPNTQFFDEVSDDQVYTPADSPVVTGTPAGTVEFQLPDVCDGPGVHTLSFSFQIEPPVRLGRVGPSTATLFTPVFDETVEARPFVEADAASTEDDREPDDDTEAGARQIQPGVVYTGHLGAPGDIDLLEIPAPPAGSSLAISLSHLPADFDLTVYGAPDELQTSPLRGTPLRGTPLRGTPVGDSLDEPGASPDVADAEGLADIPLRGTPLRGTSINRGEADESVTVVSKPADVDRGTFLVQVSGFDEAFADEPYVLRARIVPGPAPAPCMTRTFPYPTAPRGTWPTTMPDTPDTLFLVNQQRLGALYGPAEAAAAVEKLQDVATEVGGVVLPVESAPGRTVDATYDAWDLDPCSVTAANAVVNEINLVVDDLRPILPTLRHIVLVGSDEVLPQARIADLTRLSNQTDYTENVRYRGQDNAISRAFLEGNILSDEPYGDFDPQPWLTGKLYVSDVGLGRLVETPDQITAAAQQFLDNDGVLSPSTGYVSGYDFLSDGATAVADGLEPLTSDAVSVVREISEQWTADNAEAGIGRTVGGVSSVNAHYDHYRALPAAPFNAGTEEADQLLTTGELPTSLLNTILFTMGCEAGLNVPDVLVANPNGAELAGLADWAQSVAGRGGVFAGNTGYGYGDTDAVAYSERLMANFAELVGSRSATIGQAMMFAKQRFQAELGVAGVYDAKALEEATFYGLPMYKIGAGGGVAPSAVPTFNPTPNSDPSTATPLVVDVDFAPPVVEEHGTHYEVVGEQPQVTHYRPIQPRLDREFADNGDGRVHGFVIEGLESHDVLDVDPAYGTPTVDLSANEPEATTKSSVFPAALQAVSSKATPNGRKDVVVLMPGQFFGDGAGTGRGTQRLYDRIEGQVLRSKSTDFDAPVIKSIDAVELGDVARIDAFSDATDIVRGIGLYRLGTDETVVNEWLKVELAPVAGGRSAVVPLPGGMKVVDLMVQLVDRGANVSIGNDKGSGHRSELAPERELDVATDPPLDGYYVDDAPTFSVDTPYDVDYSIAIDDGPATPFEQPVTVDTPGPHRVAVTDPETGERDVVSFFLDPSDPIADISSPTAGTYAAGAVPGLRYSCTDPGGSGVAAEQCVVSGYSTQPGTHTVELTATDRAGNVATDTVTYTVTSSITFGGFTSPVDAPPIVNRTKAGSTVPVKFRLLNGDGTIVTDLGKITSITSASIPCQNGATVDAVEETLVTTGSSLRYDAVAQRFHYNWKTDKGWSGQCRRLTINWVGGSTTALFNLTK
jgi:hypothetical protein